MWVRVVVMERAASVLVVGECRVSEGHRCCSGALARIVMGEPGWTYNSVSSLALTDMMKANYKVWVFVLVFNHIVGRNHVHAVSCAQTSVPRIRPCRITYQLLCDVPKHTCNGALLPNNIQTADKHQNRCRNPPLCSHSL